MCSDINEYNNQISFDHRRKHGQFFTPYNVAEFMCKWVMDADTNEVFDPAFGLGAFFRATRKLSSTTNFSGIEIDSTILDFFHKYSIDQRGLAVVNNDYLSCWGSNYSAIVCNPPYMRFQNFLNREEVFLSFKTKLGMQLSGYTNSASAFLLKSLSELKRGGRLAYIMPMEFLNTGYGTIVKRRLLQNGNLKAIIRLEAEKEVFPDATTSVGIILVVNDGNVDPIQFYTVTNMDELPNILSSNAGRAISVCSLDPSEKWLKHFDDSPNIANHKHLVSISEYGRFSRGIATGANEFFVLSPSKAAQLKIPNSLLVKCITKSQQIKKTVFHDDDINKIEGDDGDIYLLNLNGNLPSSALDYVKYGEAQGFHLRYLTKMRHPWYKIERRTPSQLLFGVFSRDGYKVVRNYSSAINLTCYHAFYPNLFGHSYVDKLFLYFRSQTARQILGLSIRRYGDGLEKFEPNDLNEAMAPSTSWFENMPNNLVQKCMLACQNSEPLPSEAEDLFQSLLAGT